jgi:hypothetical protein
VITAPVSTSRPVPWRSEPTARPMLASGTTITVVPQYGKPGPGTQ